jgi:geranylgeranyl diphosphate synthase, type II
MMQTNLSFAHILVPYKNLIEQRLQEYIEQLGPKSPLRDACEYALLNGGKRFRPALVLMIAQAIGFEIDVFPAAMGIEFFHTASLIADDLPCMDNDDVRRNKPTVHRVYGESIALLSTYAFISAGYACLARNAQMIKHSSHPFAQQSDHLCVLAFENASYNTGLQGATGGQYLDLAPPDLSLAVLKEVIYKKTVTLFEISFVLGWLFGGGELIHLDLVKKGAAHFGMAFQIADDLEDMEQDLEHNHSLNIANVLGKEDATQMFHKEMEDFNHTLTDLKLNHGDLRALASLLVAHVQQME